MQTALKHIAAVSLCVAITAYAQTASAPKLIAWITAEQNLVHRVLPQYPPLAQTAGISGVVLSQFEVSDSGAVTNVRVVRGHPLLVAAALNAIRHWQFTPFMENGHAIPITTRTEIRFGTAPDEHLADQLFRQSDACSVAYQAKHFDEARQFCEAGMRIAAQLTEAHESERMDLLDHYGQVLLAQNEPSNAVAQFKSEVAITKTFPVCGFPDCAFAHYHLAFALQADGQKTAALPQYEAAEKILANMVKESRVDQIKQQYANPLKQIYAAHGALLTQLGDSSAAAKIESKAATLP